MIELHDDNLVFSFPEVHQSAVLTIRLRRTLRIPDDYESYPLPPGLGSFHLKHVDDFDETVPQNWIRHGGVMFPMYQAEAMWLQFVSEDSYPFAVRVAAGKICAVSGDYWTEGLQKSDWNNQQNYLVVPRQPWLDGFAVERNVIRQFVAMPLGEGYSTEEQITGESEFGGLQIQVYPMIRKEYEARYLIERNDDTSILFQMTEPSPDYPFSSPPDMGLSPGGRMKQQIFRDEYGVDAWDHDHTSRCFVHIANSERWRMITGQDPPQQPVNAERYAKSGLPWFSFYEERPTVKGSDRLRRIKSVAKRWREKNLTPLKKNAQVPRTNVTELKRTRSGKQVREW